MDEAELARRVIERGLASSAQLEAFAARRRAGDRRTLRQLLAAAGVAVPSDLEGPAEGGTVDPRRLASDLAAAQARDPFLSLGAEAGLTRERTLGEGGMGVVHLVTERRLGRRAALKVAKPGDEASAARFIREAQVTARLDHPGIPPVHDAGRSSTGELFMLMKLVDGSSLETVLAKKPRAPERELVGVLAKVADAVAYAHSKGVIHRDLKPANVMIGAFGEVLVMDWGLARTSQESSAEDARLRSRTVAPGAGPADPAMTQAGSVLGTLGYMPPEQAGGEDVDARADVFALGAILCEILTEAPPVVGTSFANKLTATVQGKIARPRDRRPGVSRELDAIAARALAVDREDRYPSATALGEDLRAWLEGRPVSVYRYGRLERGARLVRQHPTLFVGLGVLLAAAAVTAGVFVVKTRQLAQTVAERDLEIAGRRKADHDRDAALAAQVAAERAQAALVEGEELLSRGFRKEARERVLEAVKPPRKPEVLRNAGRLLARLHAFDDARRLLKECASEFPPACEALLLHSELEEQLEGAEPEWGLRAIVDRAGQIHENEDREVLVLARVRLALRQPDVAAALAIAETGFQEHPSSYRVGVARVRALFASGRQVWNELKELRSRFEVEDAAPYLLRAESNLRDNKDNVPGALFWCERACDADPENPQTWLQRARLEARLPGSDAASHRDLLRALGIRLDLPSAQREHAAFDCRLTRFDPLQNEICRKSLVRFLELYPDAPEASRVREKLERLGSAERSRR